MVSSPHALASQAGLRVLQDGGNAADGAIAVAAALSVLYPHMTGLGGDAFFLHHDATSGCVDAYNGSGAAAQLATRDFYLLKQQPGVPDRGPLAALTVPGTIDAWFALHAKHGSFEMGRLLEPAIGYAHDGAPIARSLADAMALHRETLRRDEGAHAVLVFDSPRLRGSMLRQPKLAATLRALSHEGRDWFYQGRGAAHIERYCQRIGSPLRAADLAAHRGFFYAPAQTPFLGYDSVTTAPNSQGIALLIAQRVLERCDTALSSPAGSAVPVHAMVEAIKLAFEERDRHVADARIAPPWEQLLSPSHVRKLAARVDPYRAASTAPTAGKGDTAYFCVVDGRGNATSYIQSLFHSFGSGVMVPELGVLLNNRGSAFSLDETLRSLQPGRRPFHTLMPCMLRKNGRPWLVYGSMGGEGQPQTALQLSTSIAHFAQDPQGAIEAPRWRWGQSYLGEAASLHLEARFDQSLVAGLRALGHRIELSGPWDESMGHAGAIVVGEDGVLRGGADPRGDGAACGF